MTDESYSNTPACFDALKNAADFMAGIPLFDDEHKYWLGSYYKGMGFYIRPYRRRGKSRFKKILDKFKNKRITNKNYQLSLTELKLQHTRRISYGAKLKPIY